MRRASSLSGERRRSAQGSASALAAEADGGTPNSASAETFPRSFKIQRASSADSLASLVRPPPAYSLFSCSVGEAFEALPGTALDCNTQGSSSAVGLAGKLSGICNASLCIACWRPPDQLYVSKPARGPAAGASCDRTLQICSTQPPRLHNVCALWAAQA